MRKKQFAAWLLFVISLSLCMPVHASEVYSEGYFHYHNQEGYHSICGYFGKETVVTVPAFIAGKPVSRIESGAFEGCDTVTKLILPDTIMEIEKGAFSGAKNLEQIEDASGVWQQRNIKEGSESQESVDGIKSYEYEETMDRQDKAVTGKDGKKNGSQDNVKDKKKKDVQNIAIEKKKSNAGWCILIGVGGICLLATVGIVIWRRRHGQT